MPGKVGLSHPGPAAGVTRAHPRPHLPARGQGQVSRAGGGTVGWGPHHQPSLSGPAAAPSTPAARQSRHWALCTPAGHGALGSRLGRCWRDSEYSERQLGGASVLSGSCAWSPSPWQPPTKRPSKLPAIRVLKAWGAVLWLRPRQGLPGRGRGSGSPQIKGLAETCQPLAPQPGCPRPQGTQEGTASLLIGSKGDGNYKAGPALLVVHGGGGGSNCSERGEHL